MSSWDIKIDCKLFAIANSKELLDTVAQIIYKNGFRFKADVMVFASDENEQIWYAFECKKEPAVKCECKNVIRDKNIPADFYPTWMNILEECGKLLGSNGIVFNLFYTQYPNGEKNATAYYSSPEGVGKQTSNHTKAAWYRNFDKSTKKAISGIGNMLIPYELYHTTTPRQVYYPAGADSSYDLMLEKKRERLEYARQKKEAKAKAEEKQSAEQEKKKGYYQIMITDPERTPFAINDFQEYLRKGVSDEEQNLSRIPKEYVQYVDLEEIVKVQGKHFTLAGAGELYERIQKMIEDKGGILHKDVVQKDNYLVICLGVEPLDEKETYRDIYFMILEVLNNRKKKAKTKIVTDRQLLRALQSDQ